VIGGIGIIAYPVDVDFQSPERPRKHKYNRYDEVAERFTKSTLAHRRCELLP
jgi:hypothetical protein